MSAFSKHALRKVLALVLTLVCVISQATVLSKALTPPAGRFLVSSKRTTLVPGVVETEFVYNTTDGSSPVSGFMVDIKPGSSVHIMAASANYNQTGLQTVRRMADETVKRTGKNVVAAINADLNWNGDGISTGPLIVDGKVISDKADVFFGITKTGEAIIGDGKKFNEVKNNLEQAVRGMGWLVRDGKVVTSGTDLAPRTAVGIRKDGSVMFFVVEGRIFPRSIGVSVKELAELMLSEGAVMALNLDGGGSTTYLAKREGQSKLELRNIPSDNGVERASISSLMVYAEPGDGVFHHAYITTEGDIYTPGSLIQFNARGVDSAGGSASLPSQVSWKVADSSYGTIDASGAFVSSGKEGVVTVQLLDGNGRKIGEGSVEVRIPDAISFKSDEFSLGFDESTDFGMRLLYKQRDVVFKEGDVIWDFDPKLGTINNNIFTSSSVETVSGTVRATIAKSQIFKEFQLVVGKLPIIIFDFENDAINAKWEASSVNGAKSAISIVHKDSGEPVRFGTQSLRLDFDFTTQQRNPGGAYAGFTDQEGLEELGVTFRLPGSPVGVGMWVYATEEAQGLWLRTGIGVDGNTNWKAFDLTKEIEGIDWVGWKYVEVNLTDFSGPYTILPGQFIRLMLTSNSFGGKPLRPTGTIYIDNIMVSYGTNPEDTQAPVVSSIKINDQEIENGDLITTSKITVETSFHDIENRYATGIDFDHVNIYIDGINYRDQDGYALNITDGKAYLQNVSLTDGVHEVKIGVVDFAGNETIEKRYFTVDTNTNNKVYLESDSNVILGKPYTVTLKADEIDNIKAVDFSFQISPTLADFEVKFSEAFDGSVEYLSGVRMINIQANRINNDSADYIFRIVSRISDKLNDNNTASYSMNRGGFEYVTNTTEPSFLKSFFAEPMAQAVGAPIMIFADTILIGDEAVFTVKDVDGKRIENAEILMIDASGKKKSLGFTNAQGMLAIPEFSYDVASFTLVAQFGGSVSFEYKFQTFDSYGPKDGIPYNINFNVGKRAETSKHISWFSNALSKRDTALIQYALKADYERDGEAALMQQEGNTTLLAFGGSTNVEENYAVYLNRMEIENLKDGQTYVYRVGNGLAWSEFREFQTTNLYDEVSFLVLGDVQTEDFDSFRNNLEAIAMSNIAHDYIVQVGDIVDQAGLFGHWNAILKAFDESGLGNKDVIHVLGNHEFYGDVNGDLAKAIFQYPGEGKYYSTENGIVYTAVINYTMNKKELLEALEWLVEDAGKSKAAWKILVTHQPPYYTNPQGGNELFRQLVPQYAQLAGMDFVFSGHDHSYARTKPLLDGAVDENGVVYFISGAVGEKRYSGGLNAGFQFEVVTDTFDSMYLSVTATKDKFTVTAMETKTGELIDTYEKVKEFTGDEKFYLVGDRLVCYECNYSRPIGDYTGFVWTLEKDIMYLINGQQYRGLLVLGKDKYYFDEETGYALVGDTFFKGLPAKFDQEGRFISGATGFVKDDQGTLFYKDLIIFKGGWMSIGNDTYYFSTTNGYMKVGLNSIAGILYEFGEDGKLIGKVTPGFHTNDKGTYYVDKSGKQLTGWQTIDGATYYFSTTTGYMVTGRYVIKGELYDFASDGKLIGKVQTGFVSTEDGTIYVDKTGTQLKGWQTIDGAKYYFSTSTGYMVTGRYMVSKVLYDFALDGKLIGVVTNEFYTTEAGTYYIDGQGKYTFGWKEIGEATYYFSTSSGLMVTGRQLIDGKVYDFGQDGKLIGEAKTGFITDDKGTYYLDASGKQLTGWQTIDGATYYFSTTTGYMVTGRYSVNKVLYEFGSDGKLIGKVSTGFVQTDKGVIYVDASGKQLTGWQTIDGAIYYFSTSTGFMVTGRYSISKVLYDFASDGKLIGKVQTGFVQTDKGVIYVDASGKQLTGWQTIDGATYYFSTSTGYMVTGRYSINKVLYEFDFDGKLIGKVQTGFVQTDGGTIYIDSTGKQLTGWQTIDGATYYFSTSTGYMVTGRYSISKVLYDFASDGKLIGKVQTGFVQTDGGVIYLDSTGKQLKGWQTIDGATYYFSTSTGYMITGRYSISKVLYDFASDGKLIGKVPTGFIRTSQGTYFLDANGKRLYGWQTIDGATYYFSTSSGYMVTGRYMINKVWYEFDSDGKLLGQVKQ